MLVVEGTILIASLKKILAALLVFEKNLSSLDHCLERESSMLKFKNLTGYQQFVHEKEQVAKELENSAAEWQKMLQETLQLIDAHTKDQASFQKYSLSNVLEILANYKQFLMKASLQALPDELPSILDEVFDQLMTKSRQLITAYAKTKEQTKKNIILIQVFSNAFYESTQFFMEITSQFGASYNAKGLKQIKNKNHSIRIEA